MSLIIVAKVLMNKKPAYVFKDPMDFKYRKLSPGTIFGECGPFFDTYVRYRDPYAKGFGGRPIKLTMNDGEVITFKGEWWSSSNNFVYSHLGIKDSNDIVNTTCGDLLGLKQCYVFHGCDIIRDNADELEERTKNTPIFEYWEFEKLLKSGTIPEIECVDISHMKSFRKLQAN
jgi:hypothetical protein